MYIYVYFTIPSNNFKYEIVIKTQDFLTICVKVILFAINNIAQYPVYILLKYSPLILF